MKNNFYKNTFILIIGGFITKILGMLIKIIITRNIGSNGIGLYMLVLPTYNLFVTIISVGMQISISKIISENKKDKNKIMNTALSISLIISIVLIIIIIVLSKPISILLHNKDLYIPILSMILSIPFIGISSVLKGYLFGKNKMHAQVISNLFEQLIRIILFITILPKINNSISSITFIIGSNIINELLSIFILNKYIYNNYHFIIDKESKKEILSNYIPITTSRLIGNISYFLEPILITNLLIINGYSSNYIVTEYGIITGYSMQLLLLPSFFTMAISQTIIPLISNAYSNKRYTYIKKKIREILFLSLLIGLIYIIVIFINPNFFMKTIYNTNKGIKYLKIMAPIFILLYIQSPLTSILQSINKSNKSMFITISGIVIKTILMIILSFMHFGIYSYIYPMLINIIYVTIYNLLIIKTSLPFKNE